MGGAGLVFDNLGINMLSKDKIEAAREFWYEALKGIYESLRKFF